MILLLKLLVVLFCVQAGEGHRLPSLIGETEEAASRHTSEYETEGSGDTSSEDSQTESSGADPSSPFPPASVRSRRSAAPPCGLRSVLLQVRDLGLGYDSDETVLFKYCSGSCPDARSNHDLTLSHLLHSGVVPRPEHGDGWHYAPCCRPTHHEHTAFLDNAHRWHKVEHLSAAGCSCVG